MSLLPIPTGPRIHRHFVEAEKITFQLKRYLFAKSCCLVIHNPPSCLSKSVSSCAWGLVPLSSTSCHCPRHFQLYTVLVPNTYVVQEQGSRTSLWERGTRRWHKNVVENEIQERDRSTFAVWVGMSAWTSTCNSVDTSTYMHEYIHEYVHETCTSTCMSACLSTYMHEYVYEYVHEYVHKYLH